MKKKKYLYSGQALLIVLLSMAVVLVVVLSILARSITDVSISSQDEDSLRAFSAAEAGIEQALIIGSNIGSTEIGNASYNVGVSAVAEGEKEFNYPSSLFSGESMTVWFVAHDEDGNYSCEDNNCFKGNQMNVCWGKEGTFSDSDTTPAIEVSIFYTTTPGNYATTRIARAAIDPRETRRGLNNFSAPDSGSCTIDGKIYQFQKLIVFNNLGIPVNIQNLQNGLQFAKVRFFYNTETTQKIGFNLDSPGNTLLPSQGLLVESSGSSGKTNRRIEVFESYGEVPELFESALFTVGSIVK